MGQKITPHESLTLPQKLEKMRRVLVREGFTESRHPEATPAIGHFKKWIAPTRKAKWKKKEQRPVDVDNPRRRTFLAAELELMYFGLAKVLQYFGGNRNLLCEETGIGMSSLAYAIKQGRLTPLQADQIASTPGIPFTRTELRPDITDKGWEIFEREIKPAYADKAQQRQIKKITADAVVHGDEEWDFD